MSWDWDNTRKYNHCVVYERDSPEIFPLGNSTHRYPLIIRGTRHNSVSPPRLYAMLSELSPHWVIQTEIYRYSGECHASVQGSGEHVVVFRPPRKMIPADVELENESDSSPRHVVDSARWRHVSCPREDDRKAIEGRRYSLWCVKA